ncbi:Transglutaminase-like superfamily protein [Ruminococcaceae bacterium YRB3002]|nr:Transglutaminase-like superfamily protein [Ruminococcaceae bacterium YRB3002]
MERLIKVTVALVGVALVIIVAANIFGLTAGSMDASKFAPAVGDPQPSSTGEAQYVDENGNSVHFNKPLKESDYLELRNKYDFESDFYPYYSLLNEEQKRAYYFIYDAAMNLESDVYLGSLLKISASEVMDIITAVYNDHPELFWLEHEANYTYGSHHMVVTVSPSYNGLAMDLENNRRRFEQKVNDIVDEARAESHNGVVHEEAVVHDIICRNCEYDLNSDYNQSAYSCLVNGRSVCSGYARAFQYVMTKLGIQTYFVTGTSYNGGAHGWNIIKLQDKYYNVDVTWDDELGRQLGEDLHAFFNVSDSMLNDSHKRATLSSRLPACTEEDLTYDKTVGETRKIKDIILG